MGPVVTASGVAGSMRREFILTMGKWPMPVTWNVFSS